MSCDLSYDDLVGNAVEQTVHAYGRLDAAFNGAAIDYARQGIKVKAVCPGMIDTPMMGSTGLNPQVLDVLLTECPIGRVGKPEEIASAVLWLCSVGASYLTGQAIAVDGAWTSR